MFAKLCSEYGIIKHVQKPQTLRLPVLQGCKNQQFRRLGQAESVSGLLEFYSQQPCGYVRSATRERKSTLPPNALFRTSLNLVCTFSRNALHGAKQRSTDKHENPHRESLLFASFSAAEKSPLSLCGTRTGCSGEIGMITDILLCYLECNILVQFGCMYSVLHSSW